jgi:hypothetical protein
MQEEPRKNEGFPSFSDIKVDRLAVLDPTIRTTTAMGTMLMLDAMPVAILEARVTSPPTRHGRDKAPKMADSLGFRRQVKLP